MWDDLVELMAEGVRTGPDRHRAARAHARGDGPPAARTTTAGEVYVYRRTGQPCLVCGGRAHRGAGGRNLFWCPRCQPRSGPAPYSEGTMTGQVTTEPAMIGPARRATSARSAPRGRRPGSRPLRHPRGCSPVADRDRDRHVADYVPFTLLVLPMLLGSLFLGPRTCRGSWCSCWCCWWSRPRQSHLTAPWSRHR